MSKDAVVAESGMFRMLHWVFKIGGLSTLPSTSIKDFYYPVSTVYGEESR
jgi:hypothetical protein